MSRKIIYTTAVAIETLDAKAVLDHFEGIPDGALMLSHADDGVIWGQLLNGQLTTGGDVDPEYIQHPRLETIQQVRFFWPGGEILIWRDGDGGRHARKVTDQSSGQEGFVGYYDEAQILWGDSTTTISDDWTRMTDGAQGLVHTVPLKVNNTRGKRPLRLTIRHYLKENDKTGVLYVVLSRLVTLEAK